MVYFDDLTIGEVIRFDNRPGRMYGWARITDTRSEAFGASIWFHYNEGQFLSSYNDCEWGTPVYYGASEPHLAYTNNPRVHAFDGSRLRLPKAGDEIVFETCPVERGGEEMTKASPWTYAQYFREEELRNSLPYRIVQAETVLWLGHYLSEHGILTLDGSLPLELDESMRLEWLTPDDVFEAVHPAYFDIIMGIPMPGGWEECDRSERLWQELVAAQPFKAAA